MPRSSLSARNGKKAAKKGLKKSKFSLKLAKKTTRTTLKLKKPVVLSIPQKTRSFHKRASSKPAWSFTGVLLKTRGYGTKIVSSIKNSRPRVAKVQTSIREHHRRYTVAAVVVLAALGMVFAIRSILAVAETRVVSSQADWEAGEFYNNTLDTTTTPGSLTIKSGGVGTWDASTPGFPENLRGNYGLASEPADIGADLTTDGSYVYMIVGGRQPDFFRYNPDTNTWKQLADAPTPFLYNSAITYYDGAIYAINGNDGLTTTDAKGSFFKYDIYTDTWTKLGDAPDVWGSTSAQGGADIESGNNGKLYAVQGGGQSGFFVYDTQTNAWSSGTSVPDPVNATTSHPLVFSDTTFNISGTDYCTTGCVYTILGSNRSFLRYDIALDQWFSGFKDFPSYTGTGNIAAGSAMAFDSANDDIFIFNGGNAEFVKYNIDLIAGSGGTWDAAAADTENTQRATAAGAAMIYLNGYVYATLGGVPEFVRYNIGTPKWDAIITQAATSTTGDNLISFVPNGADCSDASGCLFVAQANAAAPIRRYLIGARTWAASVNSTPAALSTGSAMCYDGSGNLYIVRGGGGSNTQVYSFPINAALDQAFTTLTAPAAAGAGADIACTADNRFYMLHGNGGVLFSYYNGTTIAAENAINANGEPYVNVSYGAALASNRTDVANATDVYALIGNGRGVLLKYNISGDTWDELPNMPTAPGTNVSGAQYTNTMVYDRMDNLYVFPGKMSKEVWRYDISGNSWSRAADAPVRLGRSHGATHGNAAGSIFLMRGENFNGIHKFNFEADDFIPAATWVSAPMDLHYVSSFTSLTSNATLNGNSIDFSTRTSDDGASWSAWASVSGTTIASAANRYIQVKAQLNSAAGTSAPVLQDFTITYEKDSTAPANPTVSGWTSSAKTTTLTTPASTFATNPYFEFTPAAQTESPIAGYYVAWTSGASCSSFNPSTSEDYFQTGTTYTVNSSVVNGTQYCLRVATKDVAGNVSSPENLFLYTYTGISPAATRQWSAQADFTYTGTTATDVNTNASSGTALELAAVSGGGWSNESSSPVTAGTGASLVHDQNGNIFFLRGTGTQTFYQYSLTAKTYTARANYGANVTTGSSSVFVPSGVSGCSDASGCIFATRGGQTEWRRYDISANTWTAASPGAGSLTVLPIIAGSGSSLSYDGNGNIYYLGGATAPGTRVYRYSLGAGTWTQLADVDQTIGLGGTMSHVPNGVGGCTSSGGCLYVTRGANTSHFFKGSIAANGSVTWTYSNNPPILIGDGTAMKQVGNFLYLIRGGISNDFYKYDLVAGTWARLPVMPVNNYQGSEQGLSYVPATNTLYTLRGYSEYSMFAFDITNNEWKGTGLPHGFTSNGFSAGAMAYDTQTGLVYAGRGQTFSEWWQLNPTTNAWLRKADVPHTLSTGADAEYVNHGTDSYDGVYVLTGSEAQGDNIGYFYRYNPTTDVWTRLTNMNNAGAAVEPAAGADLVWDGADAIYTALGTSTAFYKYTISTNSWSILSGANQPLWLANGAGSCAERINVGGTEYIYLTRGVTTAAVYRFNIGTQQWDAAGTVENSPNLLVGDACVNDGQGNLLFPRGASGVEMYVLDPDGDANGVWTTRAVPQTYTNGNLVMTSNNVILGNRGTSTSAIDRYIVATASTGYEDFGQWTSEILDFGAGLYGYGGLAVNAAEATEANMVVETRTCSDSGCAASTTDSHWGSWTPVTNTHPVGTVKTSTVASALARYGQVRIAFRSDQVATPTVYDITWSSYTDGTDPTNPVSASAYTDNGKTVTINPGAWTNDATPYFEWTGSDNAGGIGLEGFYVYFGTDNGCTDPSGAACNASNLAHVSGSHYYAVAGDGVTGSWNAASQSSTALTSGTYYLKIMSRDRNGNITDTAAAGFTFQVDIANPSAPGSIVATPAGYSSLNSFGFTWTAGSDTGGSGINQYCYTTEGPGAVETCVSAATLSVANIQAYQARANVFKVRSRDLAGNYSATYAPVNYYFSGNTPAAPQGLVVTPTSQTDNNTFSFSWGLPSNCLGQTPCDEADILRYCYTLNELPSATACGFNTAGSATPSPDGGWTTSSQTANRSLPAFSAATKQGTNTFYLIAADAIGNIDYTAFATVDFTFTSTAPGAPGSVQAIDSSDRSTKRYSVTLTWDEPTDKGSGVEEYAMYRCTKESATATNCDSPSTTDDPPTNYARIATTQNLGYLDLGLDSTKVYAYFLRAVGTGGALSGNSSVVAEQPEGRYTTPPAITEGPIVLPDSFAATVNWRTERTASSFVEFGLTVDNLGKEQGTATQIDAHEVRVTGLQAKTTYFFRVKSIDIDENIALSSIGQFTTLEAPRVENVKITDVRLNDAVVSWTTTKESTAVIQYGPTTDYGFTFTAANSFSTTHTVKLENLRDGTTYHMRLEGKDRADNPIASDDYSFTTLTFPKILTVSAENKAEGQTEVKWTTNVQTTSEVEYYNENAAPKTQGNSSLVREHSILVFGLEDATEYKFKVRGRDQFGYEAVSGENKFRTLEDTTPPVISEVKSESNTVGSGDAAKIQIIVSWKTNEPTTSQVQYGEGLAGSSYSAETDENAERVRDHLVVIGGLTPAKTYHFRVVSKDKAGNESKSQGYSILTSRARQSFLQIVIGNLEDTFSWLGGIGNLFGG